MKTGYFGKLPERADFVAKGLPESFLAPFDQWLRNGMQAASDRFGPGWRAGFAAAPPWFFALSAGVAGPDAVTGVMLPSHDRSGREFPFILAARGTASAGAATIAATAIGWLEPAGRMACDAVNGALPLTRLDQALGRLGLPKWPAGAALVGDSARGWRLDGAGHLALALPRLLDGAVALTGSSLWWSPGAVGRQPASILVAGLPASGDFARMILGQ